MRGIVGVGSVGLAGCTDLLEQEDDSNNSNNDNTENGTETKNYSLNFSTTNIDLTDLGLEEPGQLDEIKDNHYTKLEYSLTENGEEINPDEVYLEINGEETEYIEEIPENQLEENKTQITVYTEINEKTHSETSTITKELPEHYLLDITIDNSKEPWHDWIETITGNSSPETYETPYRFDKHDFSFNEYYEKRKNALEERTAHQEPIEKAEEIDFTEMNKEEKITAASELTNNEIEGASAAAQSKALTMEQILREHTSLNEPIIAGGFNNSAADDSDRGAHGSQILHVDGDNYHSETYNHPNQGAVHVNNIEDISMKSDSNIGDYVSVVGELSPEFEQVSYENGMQRLNELIRGFTFQGELREQGSMHDHKTGFKVRDLIVENKFEDALLGEMIAAHHGEQENRDTLTTSTENNTKIISIKDNDGYSEIWEKQLEGQEILDYLEQK